TSSAEPGYCLDFDGPITLLMPPPHNVWAAECARTELRSTTLPAHITSSTDHLEILRYAQDAVPERRSSVEAACSEAEVSAARSSIPSAYSADWISHAKTTGTMLAVVSNNSEAAVRTFLDRYGWTENFATLSCRDPHDARLMKPSPSALKRAYRRSFGTPRGLRRVQ
ncbi:MAG: HAD family hydrolase, partial [Rhodoglobus sp.]